MADYKDVFGIAEGASTDAPPQETQTADALSLFGVPVEKKEEE